MVTWKVIPVYPPLSPHMVSDMNKCRVCSRPMNLKKPYEVLALYCSKGGFERAQLMRDISIPVYVCSVLCGEAFILGRG